MRIALFCIILFSTSYSAFAARICYFSLNNAKEFTEMKKFSDKLNSKLGEDSKEKIEIIEFLSPGEDAEAAFQKMINSNVLCDGLVISGHHTGAFGGMNSPTTLSIDFIEKLSCDPKNKEFFNYIKALWLQGCRTLGVGKIESYESADYHTERVGNVLEEDDLRQSFADLNIEFSATLDKDNPLSSRYLRIFPRATTFGWTKTAPGTESKSEYSIPFHIANIARLNDDRGRYFDNPVGEQISPESALTYLTSFDKLLGTTLSSPVGPCPNLRDETMTTKAWINHGTKSDSNSKYSFSIPDLNAYEALFKTNNEILLTAKSLECYLKTSNNVNVIMPAIDEILKNEALVGYSFNSIHELIMRFKLNGDIAGLVQLQDKLKGSLLLQKFLMRKLASSELGVLRKIDYYSFWKELTGDSNSVVEDLIDQTFLKMALTPIKENDYPRQDFVGTLFKSMAKHGLLNEKTISEMILKGNSFILQASAHAIEHAHFTPEQSGEIFAKIVKSNKADKLSMIATADAIGNSKKAISGIESILNDILDFKMGNDQTLNSVAMAVGNSHTPIPAAFDLLSKIVKADMTNEETLRQVVIAVKNSKVPIKNGSLLFEQILASRKASEKTLNSIAGAINDSHLSAESSDKILKSILNSEKSSELTLGNIADTVGKLKIEISSSEEILNMILVSNKTAEKTLRSVADAVGNSQFPIQNSNIILSKIVSDEKSTWITLKNVAYAVGISKNPINDSNEILKTIVNSDRSNYSTLSHVAYMLGISKHPIKEPLEILNLISNSKNANDETIKVVAETKIKLGL